MKKYGIIIILFLIIIIGGALFWLNKDNTMSVAIGRKDHTFANPSRKY